MAQIVRLKDEGIAIRFPDDMSPSDIETVIRTQIYGQDVIKNVPPEGGFLSTLGLSTEPTQKEAMSPSDIASAQIELEAKQRGMSPEAYKESVLRGKKSQETKQKTTQGQGSVLSDLLDDVEIGVITPVLQFNELIGLGELNRPWYERFRQKTERMEAGPTRDWKLTHRIIQGVSGLLPQIGMDVMTGGATKALTAERLVPWASKLLDMIPSFALGWGVREAASEGKEAIKGKEAPVTVATKILQGLGEGISKGMLWESLGTLNRAGRWLGLPALTTADTVYEKIKRGQPITKDDILDSAAEGLAYSALFEGMPQLFQYGKRKVAEAQFKRLSEPIKKTVFNDLRDQLIEGRSLGKLTDKDLHKYEKKYPELLKDIKYKAFKNVKNVVETGKDDSGNPIDINELLNDDRIKALGLDKSIHQMRGETVPEEPSPPVTEGESAFLDILEKTLKSPKKTTTEEATAATEQLAKPEEKATPPTDETKLSSEQIKISKKEKLTKEDVGNILAKQPLNKGKSHKDLVDKWVSSDNFTLMDIPVDSVGMATEPKDIPRTEGPIIVDENINEIGRYKGRYGAPPDVIVLDGKHRLAKAIQNGEKTIKAYVGDKAIPHLKEAIKQFNKKQQDITKAVISYWEKPNGTTLRELSIVLSDKDKINKIREARKAFSEGRLSSLDVFKEYKNEPWANEALNKLRSELTKKKTTNRVLNGGKLIEVKPDGSDSIFRIEGRNVEVLSKKEKAGTGEQVKEYKQPWEMTKKEWNKKLTRDNVFAEKVIEDIKNMGVNVSPAGDVYITSRTDIDELADKYPLMSVRVKDVNGHRATINITNFAKLAKIPAFTDRVRSVQLYLQYYPEEKGSGFMDNIFETGQRKLLQRKEKRTTEPIKLVEGIDYINNSTITRTKQAEFISALTNPRVQKYLKRYGIKKFIIDPPYKFELSEQANIDKKRRVLRINADVDDPVNSILHEIGHLEYDKLSKEKRRKWASILSRIHNKAVDGYKKLNLPEEAYAETFAHQGEPWADEALKKLSEAKLTPKEAKEGEEKAKEEKLPVPATSRPKAKMTQDQIEVINGAIDLHKYYLNRGGETLLHLEEAAKEGIIPKELVKPILDRIVQLERQGKLGETGAEWRYSVKKVREYFDDILAEKGFEVATTPKEEARQKKEKSSVLPPEVIKEIKKLEAELDKIKKEYNLKQSLRGPGAIGQTKETALLWDKMQEIKKKIDALKAPIREAEWKRIEEEDRAKREAWAKKREKEVAEAPVFRKINGWEIVKHSGDYVVRDPYTKEDVYRSSRYKRAEEVAKESKPEKPAAKEAEQKEKQIQKEIPKTEVEPKPEETKKEEKKRLEKEAEAPPEYVIKYDEMPAQIAHEPYTPAVQDKVKRMVNKMRLAVKDFQRAPVFTVVKGDRGNLRLGFTDSYRFKFWPEVFNINGAELKEGQKIRIDLDSFKKKRRKLSYEKSILADKDKAYTGNGVTIAGDIAYASQVTNEPKRGVLIHNLPKEEIEKINQKMLGELLPSFDTTVKAEETTKIEDLDSGRYFLKVGENAYIPYKAAKFFASNSDKPLMFEYDSKAEKKFAGVKAGDRLIGFVGVYEDIRHSNEELPNGLPKPKKANEGKFGDLRELLTGEFSTQEKKGVSDAGIERESKTARKVLQGKRIKEAKGEKRLTYSDPVAEKHLRNWADSTIKDKGDVKEVREAVDATIDAIDKLPPKTKKLMEQLTIEHKRPPIVIRKDFSGIPDEFIGTYKQAAAVTVNRMRIDIPPGKKPTESVLRHELVHFKWNDLDSSKNSKAQELIKIAYEEAVEDASRAIKYAFSSKAKKEAQELINKNDPWLHDSIKYIKQRALSMARKAKKTPGKDITFSLELDLMVGGEHDVQRLIKHISGIEYPTDVSTIAFYNALARRYDLKLSESYGKEEFAAYKAGVDKEFAEELLGTLATTEEVKSKKEQAKQQPPTTQKRVIYHGSPYVFKKFSTKKIGTGEGAQAFGWGLYLTDLEDVAKYYADIALRPDLLRERYGEAWTAIYHYLRNSKKAALEDIDATIKNIEAYIKKYGPLEKTAESLKKYKELRNQIENDTIEKPRNLYKIVFHKDEYNWLDWHKPISSENKNKIIKQVIKEQLPSNFISDLQRQLTGENNLEGKTIYGILSDQLGSDKEASLFLLRAGIDGIRYPTGTLSGIEKKGNYNYVIFDPDIVTIEDVKRFSISNKTTGKPLAKSFVDFIVKKASAKWKEIPEITVVEKQADLPKDIQRPEIIKGAYYKDKVYLVAENLTSHKDVIKTLAEEIIGHAGLRKALDSKLYNRTLDALWSKHEDDILPIAKDYKLDITNPEQRRQAVDEWIAKQIADDSLPKRIWQRLVFAVKAFMRKLGYSGNFTLNEIKGMLRAGVIKGYNRRINEFAVPVRYSLKEAIKKKEKKEKDITASLSGTQQLYDALSKSKTIKELGEELNKIRAVVSPTGVSEKAKTGAAIRRGNIGRATLIRNAFVQKAQPYSKAFQALPDDLQMEISMQIEEGRANKENLVKAGVPEKIAEVAERYAKFHKKTMDFVWKALNDRGLLNEYIENYLSHIWKKPDEATKKFNDIFQKRPLSGNKYYLKKRVIDYYRTGIEQLGLKPKYTNPVDIDTAYIAQALKLISIHDTIQELKDIGAWKFVKKGQKPPEGFAKVDDPVADVWFRTEKGLVSPGNYYAPADIARILNNEASRGLYGRSKAYDLLRETNTAWNMANLGMSGYHATFSHITWATHYGALGVSELLKGDFKLAARNLIKAIPGVNLPAFAKDIKRGEYLRKLVLNPELAKTPWEKTFIQWCEWVNADPKLDRYYALSAWEDMTKLIRQKKYIKALPKLPLAIIELSSKLIMEHLVPDLKYVSFADLLEHELERKAPKNELEARKIATEVYDMVEDRFGQMTYDNLFWDRRLKDILMLSLRSVGWNYGDIREVAGATENVGQIVKDMIMEKKLPRNKDLSNRVIFVMMVPIVAGLYGAAYEYLHGVKIKSEFDLIAPRTGRKNEDGSDERVMFASYLKDWIALAKEHHRGRIIRNKLSPVLNTLINLWENEDYWGNEIYGADNKLQDIAKYVIKQWPPFSIQGYKKMREHGATVKEALEPSAGITLAPKYITNTPAQEYIYETYHKLKGIRTKEEQPEFEWKREFRKELKETGKINKELLHEGIKKHYIRSRRGIQSLLRSSKKSRDVFMLTTLKTVHQVKALLLARDDEIPKYYLAVSRAARKILRKEYPERYRHIIKVLKDMKKKQK